MHNGLKIIQLPGYYGYAITKVGWLRRIAGDEWELCPGARTVLRTSGTRGIDRLATDGPQQDHSLKEPSRTTEEIHRLLIRRSVQADPAAWAEYCPPPADWKEPPL